MKPSNKSFERKLTMISRKIVYLSIIFFIVAGILFFIPQSITILFPYLFVMGVGFGLISAIVPGVLLILGYPNLAYSWRNGRYPYYFSETPWELLSDKEKRIVYVDSIGTLLVITLFSFFIIKS